MDEKVVVVRDERPRPIDSVVLNLNPTEALIVCSLLLNIQDQCVSNYTRVLSKELEQKINYRRTAGNARTSDGQDRCIIRPNIQYLKFV